MSVVILVKSAANFLLNVNFYFFKPSQDPVLRNNLLLNRQIVLEWLLNLGGLGSSPNIQLACTFSSVWRRWLVNKDWFEPVFRALITIHFIFNKIIQLEFGFVTSTDF